MNDVPDKEQPVAPSIKLPALQQSVVQFPAILENIDNSPFSNRGFEILNDMIKTYINDLVDESSKVSKRFRADSISAIHVEKAAEHLATGSGSKTFRHVGTIGGILLGAGLSTVLSMVSTNTVTILGLISACGFSMIGAFLVALHMAKE